MRLPAMDELLEQHFLGVGSILGDPVGVVWVESGQRLSGSGTGPITLGVNDRGRIAESDLLSKWIGPEASSASDG